jgi:hypothetical protein
MTSQGQSKILSLEDIKGIKPNLDALKVINRNIAQQAEILFFDVK